MNELGLGPTRSYAKCAKIVGEGMGNYHRHGDSPIYDALVRMAQDFSMRAELVDGQGNFGSVDDDPPAAMRYSEARLSRIATEMLRDLDMDTVDFGPNYDGSRQEPLVLPARFPNLLVNGSSGIAVGMATNIPPHNLREVIAATIAYIDDPDIGTAGLMRHIRGPDFPTGGIILGQAGTREAYETGRGRVRVPARAHADADHLRREHGRTRRQRAPHARPPGDDSQLRRAPARGDRAPRQARARREGGARPHPPGPTDRARQPGRDH